jgi:nitrogen fixation protein NifQ
MKETYGLYETLMAAATMAGAALFDAHVVASILSLAQVEAARDGGEVGDLCGLSAGDLDEVSRQVFGGMALYGLGGRRGAPGPQERDLGDILAMNAGKASRFELLLARMVARRALCPNHLWQDLGLRQRGELTELMRCHFPRLAQRNAQDMKWKKFFYRMMCSAEGFSLCAAPVCTECDDFDDCFGAEEGDALLARMANGKPLAPASPWQGGLA